MVAKMSFRLTFSTNSVRNTAICCQDLGIRYEISKRHGVVSVYRWDASISRNLRVGEFQLHTFSKDKVKLGGETQWREMDTFLYKSSFFSSSRSFIGNNGKEYRWKAKSRGLILYSVSHKTRTPLMTFHRHYKRSSYLEVHDPGVLHTLDNIIVSFLIMERRRRDNEGSSAWMEVP